MADVTSIPKKAPATRKKAPAARKVPADVKTRARAAAQRKTKEQTATQKAAEAEKKAKAQEREKLKAEREKAKVHRENMAALKTDAREIRQTLERAEKAEGRADDLRITAAKKLNEVKSKLDEKKESFKDWCDNELKAEGFTFGYTQARDLARIGSAEDPVAAMLEYRKNSAERKRKARAREKQEKAGGAQAQIGHNSTGNSTATGADKAAAPKKSAYTEARERVEALDDKSAASLAESLASSLDMRMVKEDQFKTFTELKELKGLDLARHAWGKLTPKDKDTFFGELAEEMGVDLAEE